jgi:opacity protein-like surface antigen
MQKFGLIIFTFLLLAGLATAQIPTSGNVFVGYSYFNADLSSLGRTSFNGWTGSLEGKVLPLLGIVADVSEAYGTDRIPIACGSALSCPSGFDVHAHEQNFLFGPRVSVSVGKFRPFAEVLFGGAHISENNGGGSDTSFATAIGGGLDYKIIRPVAWRFEGDYVQTRFFGSTQNNVRLSTGIVLRF